MTVHWFTPWGWIWRPVAVPGVLACLAMLAFDVLVFLAVDRQAHSVSDTLFGVFPFMVPAFLLLDWLAVRTGGRGGFTAP